MNAPALSQWDIQEDALLETSRLERQVLERCGMRWSIAVFHANEFELAEKLRREASEVTEHV